VEGLPGLPVPVPIPIPIPIPVPGPTQEKGDGGRLGNTMLMLIPAPFPLKQHQKL